MKRVPGIHITENRLAKILHEVLHVEGSPITCQYKKLAKEIVFRAKNDSLNNRVVTVTNNKVEGKIKTLLKAKESDSELLANLIYHIRRSKTKLYTSKKITKDSRDYKALKELTVVCLEFCETFGLGKRQGFMKYLDIGIPKISSSMNFVHKLVNMAETIYTEYEAIKRLEQDKNWVETKAICDLYIGLIAEKTGVVNNYKDKPLVYQKFMEVAEITDNLDVPVEIYLKAQFHGLSWTDSYPEPHQLVNEKALERLNKYLYENKISLKNKAPEDKPKNILLKLKNKYGNDRSD